MVKKKTNKSIINLEWINFNKAMLLLLLIALFVILKTVFTTPDTVKPFKVLNSDLIYEANILLNGLTEDSQRISILNSNELIEGKLDNLDQMDYDEIKNILGIKNDFCIYFESINGDVLKINSINSGIGSDKIYINGKSCK